MTIFYSDVEPRSKYSPVRLHLILSTRILHKDFLQNISLFFGSFITIMNECFLIPDIPQKAVDTTFTE